MDHFYIYVCVCVCVWLYIYIIYIYIYNLHVPGMCLIDPPALKNFFRKILAALDLHCSAWALRCGTWAFSSYRAKAFILARGFFYHWATWEVEKAMAPHSSTLAWKIPWLEEPGRLQSTGSLRVRQNWATSLSLFTFFLNLFLLVGG